VKHVDDVDLVSQTAPDLPTYLDLVFLIAKDGNGCGLARQNKKMKKKKMRSGGWCP
jgi:hypothetical protein